MPEEEINDETPTNSADKWVKKFFSAREKKPVVDQDKLDRLQRMGRINEIGRGVSVLGDILGSGLGAPVKRRQPDSTAPALYQNYQNTLDKYKDDIDKYDYRSFQKNLQDALLGISRADRGDEIAFRNKKQKDDNAYRNAKNALDWQKYLEGLRLKKEGLDNTKAYQKGRLGIEGEKLKLDKEKLNADIDKPFDPIQVKDKFGKNVKLPQGDWDQLYQDAMKDKDFTKNFFPALKAQFESVPDVLLKQTARAYYEYKQNKEQKEGEKESLNKYRKEKGLSTDAKQDIQATPNKATKKVPSFFQ